MIKFNCTYPIDKISETWKGYISRLVYYGSHYEMRILGKVDISVILGNTSSGYFLYLLEYETGFNIQSPTRIDDNASTMMTLLDDVDAVTVAYAINEISGIMGGNQKRCKRKVKNTNMVEF